MNETAMLKLFKRSKLPLTSLSRCINNVTHASIPQVSSSDIKTVLVKKNFTFEEGHTCFITPCTLCKDTTSCSKKGGPKIYINKTTGSFLCSGCIHNGSWNELNAKWDCTDRKKPKFNELSTINTYLKDVEENTIVINEDHAKLFTKFNLPQVPEPLLKQLNIRVSPDLKTLYFPLSDSEAKLVGYLVVDSNKTVIKPLANSSGILNANLSRQTAVIVPNVADFLALVIAKLPYNVICLPSGLQRLPQELLPSLERYKKLVLWFGNAMSSWDCAIQFAKKLGEKRCFLVRPFDQRLPHLMLPDSIKATIESAQPMWHKSIINFAALREDVFAELQNIDKVEGVKWKRFPALTKILKGHRRGELTVLSGPTGSGKTTFVSEYSLDLAMQGVCTLWGSFEIRNTRLARTMLQQMAGISLQDNMNRYNEFANEFEKLPMYFMTFHGQQTIKIVMDTVEHAQYVYDITHVIVDNVQFMMGMSEESKHMDRFWKQDAIIAAFRTFATRRNCHVTLVIHPRKEREEDDLTTSSIFGGAKASQEADNILLIQYKKLSLLKGKKLLQVAKNRYSGDLGAFPLDFNKDALSFAPKKKSDQNKSTKRKTSLDLEENSPPPIDLELTNANVFPELDSSPLEVEEPVDFICESEEQSKRRKPDKRKNIKVVAKNQSHIPTDSQTDECDKTEPS